MYGIEAETKLDETEHGHLEGYRGSRPVRSGNGAYEQRQMDVYGEVLDWALLFRAVGGRLERDARALLEGFVEIVAANWREPDQGLWEMRGPPRHHVFGKLMSWVAADRATKLLGDERWTALRNEIEREIRERGIDADGTFRGSYEESGRDAALLLLPVLNFPLDGKTLDRTIDAVRDELGRGDFLRRYSGEDGVEGEEGAFLMCSFWLVDALLCAGRDREARELFERLLGRANDVGLYAEEIDPEGHAFLGNFPQAFTHMALIGSAARLRLFERGGPKAIIGTKADRARRSVRAVYGWRAVLWAMWECGRLGRIFSSRKSVLSAFD